MENNLVYFANHPTQGDGLHSKIGHTSKLYDRKNTMNTSFSVYCMRFYMLIMCKNVEEEKGIEELLHSEYIEEYSTMNLPEYEDSGIEWFNRSFNRGEIEKVLRENGYHNEIITDKEKIKEIQSEYDKERINVVSEYKKKMIALKRQREIPYKIDRVSIKREIKWHAREYQTNIIGLGLNKLSEFFKFYLELATGAGKTYIVFNIFKKIKPDVLFCLSPRLKINKQNIGEKYLSVLDDEYEAFNLSSDTNLDEFMRKECKKVIIGCTSKGCDKIIDIIDKYNISDSSLWIDECHWGVEGWITKGLSVNQAYLLNNTNIKYKVFTSASPNTEIVEQNEAIFGELFKEITVKELIESDYLCHIKPFIFEVNEDNIDYCKTIIEDFTAYGRKWGLSFHNKCLNAFHMFLKHYALFKKKQTQIKPFLLIRDNLDEILKTEVDKINYKNVYLDYEFISFDEYESNNSSIAYVVKKCDMGYDFDKIDYISLTDKKMSYSDLIQCIGRGLRSDCLGENGKNKEKELYLMIPNYIDEENADNYDNIINVIQYLQFDIGLEWGIIENVIKGGGSSRDGYSHEEYRGDKIIQSKIMDAMKLRKVEWTLKKLLIYCKNNNIHNIEEYYNYRDKYPSLGLPEIFPRELKWSDTYKKHNYYSKEECIEKIKNIMEENDINDDDEEIDYYHNIDNKIPDMYLVDFYGGCRNDYPCY
jgi:hypothetical protein